MSKPLQEILVVALEQAVAAPFCTRLLADAGARVIKVERKEGDFARHYDDAVNGESTYFTWLNYGKESIVMDLKSAADLCLLKKIIQRADILVQNFSPGSLDRLGLSRHTLKQLNPGLIHCSIRGYGGDGPHADRKAYDLLIQAESGLAFVTGSPQEPGRVGVSVCDIATGLYCHSAILEALIERNSSRQGKTISLSMFDAMAEWMAVPLLHYDYSGKQPNRVGLRHPSIAPYGVYMTRDNKPILIAVQNEREWSKLCERVFTSAELLENPDFGSNILRVKHRELLEISVAEQIGKLTYSHCVARLTQAQIAYGDVNDISGLSTHPHLNRTQISTPSGVINIPASPIRANCPDSTAVCPALGQHTESIMKEFS